MKLLTATLLPLELSAQIKDEILPIVLFFGMFFVVFSGINTVNSYIFLHQIPHFSHKNYAV